MHLYGVSVHDNHVAGFHIVNAVFRESQVRECHAFAGGCEQSSFVSVAEWAHTQRITRDEHLTASIKEHDIP